MLGPAVESAFAAAGMGTVEVALHIQSRAQLACYTKLQRHNPKSSEAMLNLLGKDAQHISSCVCT